MEVTYSWIIYSCLIFGTGILCDRKLERRQAVSSSSENTDDKFNCLNGQSIEWLSLCDGHRDCSDGSDETKELCALYEFETNMTMDCGRVHTMKNLGTPEEAHQSIIELSPWTVAVYRRIAESKFEFIQPASIIAPNIVISNGIHLESISRDYREVRDLKIGPMVKWLEDNKLFIDVTMIYRTTKDIAIAGNKRHKTIVVIVLANKLPLSNGFTPICIDWFSTHDLRKETQLRTIGYKYIEDNKEVKVIQYFTNYTTEINKTSSIKFFTNPHIDNVFRGSGLSILYSKSFFLTGIVCKWLPGIDVNEVHRMEFTDIKYYVPWIRGILNKHVTVNSCILPTVEGVIYSFEDSNEILSHGTLIDRHVYVIENCEVGYHKVYPNSFRVCQGNGKWKTVSDKLCLKDYCVLPNIEGVVYTYEDSNESLTHGRLIEHHVNVIENCEIGYHKVYPNSFRVCQRNGKWKTVSDKLCLKMCPPLEIDSLDIKCTHNCKYANCSNPSIPDTIAKPSCKLLYTAPNGHEYESLELLCQPNGTWNQELYRCNPSCGKIHTINTGKILGGGTALAGTAPWNVGMYRFNEIISNNYDWICGGSIISPNLVVSAAHCFLEQSMSSNRISANDGQYKIAVGKYSRNITTIDNEFTKIMNIETVYLNEFYYENSGFRADDISIVVLRNRISFSIGVSPICVDWIGINTIPNGAEGKTVAWGKTEKGIDSPILLEASLLYIDHSTCRKMYTNGFESFVTKDKFCAGSALGQGMLELDIGAGLSFLHSNLYYLTGVASVRDTETNHSITAFTEVQHHIQFIRRIYEEHN